MSNSFFISIQRLLSTASLTLLFSSNVLASSITPPKPRVLVQGGGSTATSGPEIGTWDFEVDLEKEQVIVKPVSAIPGVKVAGLFGFPGVGYGSTPTIYNNTTLQNTGGRTFASASLQVQITNQSGTTLGQSSPTISTSITGVKLLLVPRSDCPTGTPTLAQPICVVSSNTTSIRTGISGRNDGTDPVYVAYMTPRDGSNLTVADDANPVELNEPTAFVSTIPTDYARSVWRGDLAIPTGQTGTFGLRFRYAQNQTGVGQPRVTNFTYRLRILADRPSGTAPIGATGTAGNNYVTTLAGNGTTAFADGIGGAAAFSFPRGVAVSPDGKTVYVADGNNNRIRSINVATQAVTTLAGQTTGGFANATGTAAQFNFPTGVAVSPDGTTVYISDTINNRIRSINVATQVVTTLAGSGAFGFANGTGSAAQFSSPNAVAVSPDGMTVYVSDQGNSRIRRINVATQAVTTLAGSGTTGFADGPGTAAQFDGLFGVAVSPDGTTVYVVDTNNSRIRRIDVATQVVTTLAGSVIGSADGTGTSARFATPIGVAVSPDGATVYVADQGNNRIRRIDVTTQAVTTVVGSATSAFIDGQGTAVLLTGPQGVAVSPDGTTVYVGDTFGRRIRTIHAIEGQNP